MIFLKRIFIILFLLLPVLCSCEKKEELLHYQKYPFEGEFEILREDASFTLRISGDALDENSGKRSFVASFLAPESMKGIGISRKDGKMSYSLGGIEFDEKDFLPVSIGDFADYFELSASPRSFSREGDSTIAYLITDKGENIRITFSSDGLPLKLEGEKMTIRTVSYKIKK